MNTRITAVCTAILEIRSLTVIHYTVEDELPKTGDPEDRALLQQIQNLNSLDEIWILCHKRVAQWHTHCADGIQKFVDSKKGKKV